RLQDVAAAINAEKLGLQAFYDPELDRFFLSTVETGEAVTVRFFTEDSAGGSTGECFLRHLLHLSVATDDPEGQLIEIGEGYTGKNAIFDFDGAKGLTRSTNEFTIGGVTYTLLKAD